MSAMQWNDWMFTTNNDDAGEIKEAETEVRGEFLCHLDWPRHSLSRRRLVKEERTSVYCNKSYVSEEAKKCKHLPISNVFSQPPFTVPRMVFPM